MSLGEVTDLGAAPDGVSAAHGAAHPGRAMAGLGCFRTLLSAILAFFRSMLAGYKRMDEVGATTTEATGPSPVLQTNHFQHQQFYQQNYQHHRFHIQQQQHVGCKVLGDSPIKLGRLPHNLGLVAGLLDKVRLQVPGVMMRDDAAAVAPQLPPPPPDLPVSPPCPRLAMAASSVDSPPLSPIHELRSSFSSSSSSPPDYVLVPCTPTAALFAGSATRAAGAPAHGFASAPTRAGVPPTRDCVLNIPSVRPEFEESSSSTDNTPSTASPSSPPPPLPLRLPPPPAAPARPRLARVPPLDDGVSPPAADVAGPWSVPAWWVAPGARDEQWFAAPERGESAGSQREVQPRGCPEATQYQNHHNQQHQQNQNIHEQQQQLHQYCDQEQQMLHNELELPQQDHDHYQQVLNSDLQLQQDRDYYNQLQRQHEQQLTVLHNDLQLQQQYHNPQHPQQNKQQQEKQHQNNHQLHYQQPELAHLLQEQVHQNHLQLQNQEEELHYNHQNKQQNNEQHQQQNVDPESHPQCQQQLQTDLQYQQAHQSLQNNHRQQQNNQQCQHGHHNQEPQQQIQPQQDHHYQQQLNAHQHINNQWLQQQREQQQEEEQQHQDQQQQLQKEEQQQGCLEEHPLSAHQNCPPTGAPPTATGVGEVRGRRRVHFADVRGLELVSVRLFHDEYDDDFEPGASVGSSCGDRSVRARRLFAQLCLAAFPRFDADDGDEDDEDDDYEFYDEDDDGGGDDAAAAPTASPAVDEEETRRRQCGKEDEQGSGRNSLLVPGDGSGAASPQVVPPPPPPPPPLLAPGTRPDFLERVRVQNVCLERVRATCGGGARGCVRVLNLAFEKRVLVRHTFDDWATCIDADARYHAQSATSAAGQGLSDGRGASRALPDGGYTDRFTFHLEPPCGFRLEPGASLELAVCYQVNGTEFWDNNGGKNYRVRCQRAKVSPTRDMENGWVRFV